MIAGAYYLGLLNCQVIAGKVTNKQMKLTTVSRTTKEIVICPRLSSNRVLVGFWVRRKQPPQKGISSAL